jgi:predicted membrane channel-forming protein YqfA (hemolysin III family)
MSELWKQEGRTHTVRPRWTWISLVVMVIGLILVGIGIIGTSWPPVIVGIVLLVVGGVFGIHGGFFYDVQGGALSAQMGDVKAGAEHEFPGAGTTRSEADVKEDVHRRWLSEDE